MTEASYLSTKMVGEVRLKGHWGYPHLRFVWIRRMAQMELWHLMRLIICALRNTWDRLPLWCIGPLIMCQALHKHDKKRSSLKMRNSVHGVPVCVCLVEMYFDETFRCLISVCRNSRSASLYIGTSYWRKTYHEISASSEVTQPFSPLSSTLSFENLFASMWWEHL